MHYLFKEKDISKFKYCPFCKADIVEIYPGDFTGHISCSECDEDLDFLILEEMMSRFPKRWKEVIKDA